MQITSLLTGSALVEHISCYPLSYAGFLQEIQDAGMKHTYTVYRASCKDAALSLTIMEGPLKIGQAAGV